MKASELLVRRCPTSEGCVAEFARVHSVEEEGRLDGLRLDRPVRNGTGVADRCPAVRPCTTQPSKCGLPRSSGVC